MPATLQPLAVYQEQVVALAADAQPIAEPATLQRKRLAVLNDGTLALADRGAPISLLPVSRSRVPTKYAQRPLRGWAALDDYFDGGKTYQTATDADVYQAMLEAAEDAGYGSESDQARGDSGVPMPGLSRGLFRLNELVDLALAHRHGGTHLDLIQLNNLTVPSR